MNSIKSKITEYALKDLQFDDCRFTDPNVQSQLDTMRRWIKAGQHADMDYLERHLPFKEDPSKLLDGVKSAVVLIKNYKNTTHQQLDNRLKVARYAAGRDYHITMRERLERLVEFMTQMDPQVQCYIGVDSRPIAERSLAVKAGVGFVGKNSMVIKPGLGSYFFIGVILSTLKMESDESLKWDCGDCRLCLDACPTKALDVPFQVDAIHCISYQTIEQKTPMTSEQIHNAQGWVFGCDICQEVCPYNHEGIPLTQWQDFLPASGVGFEVFEDDKPPHIPRDTALYRSRKRVLPNVQAAKKSMA